LDCHGGSECESHTVLWLLSSCWNFRAVTVNADGGDGDSCDRRPIL
jgi:hypothetical protein